jgi:hypothetical protein
VHTSDIHKLAYLAGIIDGEGCITISRASIPSGPNRSYVLSLSVANTNYKLPQWIKDNFGGAIYSGKAKNPNGASRQNWNTYGDHASELLEQVLPYLLLKTEEAELGVAFQKSKTTVQGRRRVPDEELTRRDVLYKKMRGLKKSYKNYENGESQSKKSNTCPHGESRGDHCWQCGGLAKVGTKP